MYKRQLYISPAVEEGLKLILFLLFLFVCQLEAAALPDVAVGIGVGFAMMESIALQFTAGEIGAIALFARAFCSALIHVACALMLILACLLYTSGEQYENPAFATETSPEGNLYLFVSSNDESDIESLFTIYEGYFVELIQYHDDYSEQTDEDDDFARSLLYGIEFSTADVYQRQAQTLQRHMSKRR